MWLVTGPRLVLSGMRDYCITVLYELLKKSTSKCSFFTKNKGEHYYLDNKYHNCIKEVNDLNAELKELEAKQIETDNLQERLRQINKILFVGEVAPEMLTVDIMNAFIYKIIAVSKRVKLYL